MKLTDHESGIVFNISADKIGAVYNKGPYRIVKTQGFGYFGSGDTYAVREQVPEILQAIHKEQEDKNNDSN